MPIGRYTNEMKNFSKQQFQLESNDLVVSFTDGYADQFGGEKGKKFRYKQFEELLTENSLSPTSEIHKAMDTAFEKWKGHYDQIDDVCVIGIRI